MWHSILPAAVASSLQAELATAKLNTRGILPLSDELPSDDLLRKYAVKLDTAGTSHWGGRAVSICRVNVHATQISHEIAHISKTIATLNILCAGRSKEAAIVQRELGLRAALAVATERVRGVNVDELRKVEAAAQRLMSMFAPAASALGENQHQPAAAAGEEQHTQSTGANAAGAAKDGQGSGDR